MLGETVRLGLGDDDDACVLNRRTSQLRKRCFFNFAMYCGDDMIGCKDKMEGGVLGVDGSIYL